MGERNKNCPTLLLAAGEYEAKKPSACQASGLINKWKRPFLCTLLGIFLTTIYVRDENDILRYGDEENDSNCAKIGGKVRRVKMNHKAKVKVEIHKPKIVIFFIARLKAGITYEGKKKFAL